MAKVANGIIEITSTGVAIKESNIRVVSIQAIASADSSACVIQDGDGMTIAVFKSAITNHRTYAPVFLDRKVVNAIDCVVWTNMEKVIIHTE